jgi:DNA-binding NarL/FixJ family response regulator
MKALALVTDLMFASRIAAEAKAAGAQVQILRKPEQLAEAEGELLLADLNLDGAALAAAHWSTKTNRRVVGFVSHIDSAAIAAAREAGVQEIMARSRFVQLLPELLRADSAI